MRTRQNVLYTIQNEALYIYVVRFVNKRPGPWRLLFVRPEPRQARHHCQCGVFLLASSAHTSATVHGCRLHYDARACFYLVAGGLLQRCYAVFNGTLQYVMRTLQRVLNVAARLVTDTRKYDRGLSTLIHDQLHWLNVPERVEYKLAVMVRRCLENRAPRYLVNCCTPVTDVASRHRRSANVHSLIVPWC